ncbi:retron Ec78 anti-phage system effector ATPase PtuA [Shewanella sp. DAU305]|uniref:retron Ec78 anti-phage system effector ATPase PtuA n=1 Tax=Shewanella sp. DAU305 TaxID=2991940 RepID=UPI002283432E|nr:retron Ec78 anti-phage system effector ATPase PtuA [Shewanella sp. DAU305]WAL77525.1 AAA family ATPase [Shewanella sp. DAU305]
MSREAKINNEIALLERSFKAGSISSGFKLYEMYDNGVFEKNSDGDIVCILDKNPKIAHAYLLDCRQLLNENEKNNRLHVSRLTLSDFRKFKTLKVKLNKNLTVIIGDNGAGKTTIIDGITKSLSWLSANILKKGGVGLRVTDYDVNIDSMSFAEVTLQTSLNKNSQYSVSLYKTAKGAKEAKKSELEAFEELGGLYRVIDNYNRTNNISEINLPLIVSYSVNRTNIKSNKTFDLEKITSVKIGSKYDAYENKSIDGTGNFDEFSEWFLALHNLSGEDLSVRLRNAKKRLDALKAVGADKDTSEIFELYTTAKEEYEHLQNDYDSRKSHIKNLYFVKSAILSTVPDFTDIFIKKNPDTGRAELKVTVDGRDINIFQTSQGQHVFISMIADIARKLVTLNPNMENPLHGQGIVLIDEIELHLHPKWQQNIANVLVTTFPNIQFIVTTHSPQVLSTVDKSSIRHFITDENGNVHCPPPRFQTKGVRSSDILAEIMGTNSIPDVEEARKVDKFSGFLLDNQKDKATELLKELEQHFGSDHPVIRDCQSKLDVFEMKERINLKRKEG